MEKRRNTLQKFGFGRKSTPTSSSSPERKPTSSKTERLKELTEKLKGHRTGSFRINASSRTSSPPPPPPLPEPPIPPPRKFRRNSKDNNSASSNDNLLNASPDKLIFEKNEKETLEKQTNLQHIGKSKSVEPSSIFSRQLKSIQERFLRPNNSASNLEALNRSKEKELKQNSLSPKDEEFFIKLARPESRTIVGAYTQKTIPYRSASFSQSDFTSGKYIKPDLAALKIQLTQNKLSIAKVERSPSPKTSSAVSTDDSFEYTNRYPLKSELSITLDGEKDCEDAENCSKRNSDIETIEEDTMAEILAEHHDRDIANKLAQINVVQASEMMLETLMEEESPAISLSSRTQTNELQRATTCIIPIPVFECIEKEWTQLPEYDGEEFCNPTSQDVIPEAKAIENFIEIRLHKERDSYLESISEISSSDKQSSFEKLSSMDDNFLIQETIFETPEILPLIIVPFSEKIFEEFVEAKSPMQIVQTIPEVELNNIAMRLDEITEKLKDPICPTEEKCNIVKTQIAQSKEELVPQKSIDSVEEIRISPEIQEVLETVAETLNEERNFLNNAIGNANLNIVSLICHDAELSASDRGTPESSRLDLLKAAESSPEPSSFDKSDSEFNEGTVRKRHSNDIISTSEKSSPHASPNAANDDRKKIDKSRRKGIYIQWPAVERSQDLDIEPTESALEDSHYSSKKLETSKKKLRNHNLGFCFSEPVIPRQSESLCSLEPCTPDSDCSGRPLVWPKNPRRQSLTCQSSDERDDPLLTSSPPLKPFRNNAFPRSESISDNESERDSSRDRATSSPVPTNEQDLKRYSKRPLRGPYGQMLEAEMKKPTKVHYDGIIEEISRSDRLDFTICV